MRPKQSSSQNGTPEPPDGDASKSSVSGSLASSCKIFGNARSEHKAHDVNDFDSPLATPPSDNPLLSESPLTQSPLPQSPLTVFSPAVKLAATFIFAICVSLLTRPSLALAACVIAFSFAMAGRLSLVWLLRKLLPINFFFIFLWFLLPLHFSSGTLTLSLTGVKLAALITLKGNAVALLLLALVGTSTASESCRGLLTLRLPEKLVTLVLLTYANLSQMQREYDKIVAAAKLRCFVPTKSLATYKTTAYLVAMLLVRSWQRSQRVNKAMRLRGFSGRYPLLALPPEIPYSERGVLLFGGVAAISLSLLCCDFIL